MGRKHLTLTPDCYISLNDNWLGGNGVWLTNNDDTGELIGYSMATGKFSGQIIFHPVIHTTPTATVKELSLGNNSFSLSSAETYGL